MPPRKPPEDLRVVAVEYLNFKRLRASIIVIRRGATAITGKNRAGKSTALDGIAATLGGAKLCPQNPISDGENEASVKVTIGGRDGIAYVATRRWWRKEGGEIESELLLDRGDGSPVGKPQTVLDACLGWKSKKFTTWAPFSFVLLGSTAEGQREQRAIMCELAGYDTGALDGEKERVTERRKRLNADVDRLAGEVASVKARMPPEAPAAGEERDVAAIAGRKAEVAEKRAANEALRKGAVLALAQAQAQAAAVRRLDDQIAALSKQREEQRKLELAADRAANDAKQAAEGLVDPDTSAIDAEIAAAKEHNARVRAAQQQAEARRRTEEELARKSAELAAVRDEAGKGTLRLEGIEREKKALAKAAKFPLPTLGVDDNGVTLNGLPFTQASAAEQMVTVVRICAALEPGIKTILVPERARIGLELLGEMAAAARESGIDLVIEHETPTPGFGIFFENGGVREVGPDFGRVPEPEAPPAAAEPVAVLTRKGAQALQALGIDAKPGDKVDLNPDDGAEGYGPPAADAPPDF